MGRTRGRFDRSERCVPSPGPGLGSAHGRGRRLRDAGTAQTMDVTTRQDGTKPLGTIKGRHSHGDDRRPRRLHRRGARALPVLAETVARDIGPRPARDAEARSCPLHGRAQGGLAGHAMRPSSPCGRISSRGKPSTNPRSPPRNPAAGSPTRSSGPPPRAAGATLERPRADGACVCLLGRRPAVRAVGEPQRSYSLAGRPRDRRRSGGRAGQLTPSPSRVGRPWSPHILGRARTPDRATMTRGGRDQQAPTR